MPSTVTPMTRRSSRSRIENCRLPDEAVERVSTPGDEDQPVDELTAAPQLAGGDGAERRGDCSGERRGAVPSQAAPGGHGPAFERLEDRLLRGGADARRLAQATLDRGCPQLVRRPDPERAAEGDEPPRADPKVAAERDELGLDLPLELGELGDAARLDELAQALLDGRPDPAQLARAAASDELLDGSRSRADQIRRAAVGAGAPVSRSREVEQGRDRPVAKSPESKTSQARTPRSAGTD